MDPGGGKLQNLLARTGTGGRLEKHVIEDEFCHRVGRLL
jgi:hypothetical protein